MLYLIYGNDRGKVNAAVTKLQKELMIKGGEVVRFSEDTFVLENFLPLLEQQALFGGSKVVICDGVAEVAGVFNKKRSEALKNSPNIFIFKEEKVLADDLKTVSTYTEKKPEKFEKVKEGIKSVWGGKEACNVFQLAGALGVRDKKGLWVLLERARRAGISTESIVGTLFWQMKTIVQAQKGGDGDLKDFPRQNARRYAQNFKNGEGETVLAKLSDAYHRRGEYGEDIEVALEKLVLTL